MTLRFIFLGALALSACTERTAAVPSTRTSTPIVAGTPAAPRHVKMGVTQAGFEPSEVAAKAGESLVLDITRVTDETCATAIVVPDQKLKLDLPLDKEVSLPVSVGKAGRVAFACPMNMITGAIVVAD